jgi:hypothetical protein
LGFLLFCLLCRLALSFEPMDVLRFLGYLLMNLIFFLGLLLVSLITAFVFHLRVRRGAENLFIRFGWSSRFFIHLGSRRGDYLSLINRVVLRDSNNQLRNYGLILLAFMEPYIMDYRKKWRLVTMDGCPFDSGQNQQFSSFRPYQS